MAVRRPYVLRFRRRCLDRFTDRDLSEANCLYPAVSRPGFRLSPFNLERPFPAVRIGGLDYAVLDALMFHRGQLDARPKVESSAQLPRPQRYFRRMSVVEIVTRSFPPSSATMTASSIVPPPYLMASAMSSLADSIAKSLAASTSDRSIPSSSLAT